MALFAKKLFDEQFRLPVLPSLIAALFIGECCWLFLMHAVNGPSILFLPPWRLQILFFGIPFLLLKVSALTRIFYQRDHLHLRFITEGHRDGISIAPDSIISCERVHYSCSLWNLPFPHTRHHDYLKIVIPGYSGDGLLITYSHPNLFSYGETEKVVLFPVKDTEKLLTLLNRSGNGQEKK